MPNSKSRTKKSRGKAWRNRRARPAASVGAVHSRLPVPPLAEAQVEVDEFDDWDEWSLEDEWADGDYPGDDDEDEDEEVFTDPVLGEALLARGWVAEGGAPSASDCWAYPRTRPDGRVVYTTTVSLLRPERYLVMSYGGEPVLWSAFYDTREEVLADIESIEAHRRPDSLTQDR
jgi:hypothetical protein